jgi:hypothetical protein
LQLITISVKTHLDWYGTTVFLSSAILLVLEITAGRLIAPYVGVTIYSWTSIIGVILAGLYTTNVVDVFPDPKMVKSLLKTMQQEFAHVDVWLDRIPQQAARMTYVIWASNSRIDNDVLASVHGFKRQWLRINEPLSNSATRLEQLPIFSDDFVPVERMISSFLLTAEGL